MRSARHSRLRRSRGSWRRWPLRGSTRTSRCSNYRAWTGTAPHVRVDAFDWNQTYGPLHWPHAGHQVMTVRAKTGDYWKAENLDLFNGIDWVAGTTGRRAGAAAAEPRHRSRGGRRRFR